MYFYELSTALSTPTLYEEGRRPQVTATGRIVALARKISVKFISFKKSLDWQRRK